MLLDPKKSLCSTIQSVVISRDKGQLRAALSDLVQIRRPHIYLAMSSDFSLLLLQVSVFALEICLELLYLNSRHIESSSFLIR